MPKKKLVINYDNLPPGLMQDILKKYPDGWMNHVIKIKGAADTFFHAILVDTEEVDYLVKVKVKKDKKGVENDEDFLPSFNKLSNASSSDDEEETADPAYDADSED